MEPIKKKEKPNPKDSANLISKFFFFWTRDIISKGCKKDLEQSDLYTVLKNHKTDTLGDQLEINWKNELAMAKERKREPNLQNVLIKILWRKYTIYTIMALVDHVGIRVVQAYFLGKVIQYFNPNSTMEPFEGRIFGGAIIVTIFIRLALAHHHAEFTRILGMQVRTACTSLIYRKLLQLSKTSTNQTAKGRVINLITNDVCRFDYAFQVIGFLVVAPLQILVIIYCLWTMVGPSALVGIAWITLMTIPVQTYFGKLHVILRKQIAMRTDERLKLMNEIVSGIQVIKMYAWEIPFSKLVETARKNEIEKLTYASYLRSFPVTSHIHTDRSTLFFTLLSYVLLGNNITPEKDLLMEEEVNGSPTYLNSILNNKEKETNDEPVLKINGSPFKGVCVENGFAKWNPMLEIYSLSNINFKIPEGKLCAIIGPVGSGKSSLLSVIMHELPLYAGNLTVGGNISYTCQEPWIFVGTVRQNIVFGQPYIAEKYKEVVSVCALLEDFQMFRHGDRTLVGEKGIKLSGGQRARIDLARAVYRNEDVYLLDDPLSAVDAKVGKHLFEKCIKTHLGNKTRILVTHQLQFIKDADLIIILNNGEIENMGTFEELQSSGLNFAKLLGDKKEIEKEEEKDDNEFHGRSYSSSRVSLRRSLRKDGSFRNSFTNEDSATTLRYVMRRKNMRQPSLISVNLSKKKEGITKNKTNAIKPTSGYKIMTKGILRHRDALRNILRRRSFQQCCPIASFRDRPFANSKETVKSNKDEIQFGDIDNDDQEMRKTEAIDWKTYKSYFGAGGHICFIFMTIFSFILAQVTVSVTDYWVSFWTMEEGKRHDMKQQRSQNNGTFIDDTLFDTEDCLIIYGVLIFFCIFLTVVTTFTFVKVTTRASTNLHNNMFSSILRGTMQFFYTNPSGRILNRFSQDIGTIDELLPRSMLPAFQIFLIFICLQTIIAVVNPVFIIPSVALAVFYYGITKVYLATVIGIKRLEETTRSPLYSHLSDTMTGLTTIRVFGAQQMVKVAFDSLQDEHTAAWSLFISINNTFGFMMDILSCLFVTVIIITFFLYEDIIGAQVGLALSQALMITGMLQFGFISATQVISQMTSVERVMEYTNIQQEPELESTPDKKPGPSWPSKGAIKFDNLCMRYAENQPSVLKNLNINIETSYKVGIVGRTGAGKSSLIIALFRLANLEGSVIIDNLNTSDLGLHDLRKKISIIPQEPVLFSKSLRYNLDPFDQYTDDTLWNALEEVDLKECITGLDMQVQEGGSNFSVGQRQLICLARAILRNNKILVLDEATANVDQETDMFVQNMIRRKFKDCTVLTIAHRLNTIMDSDRVLVMDAGFKVEYDHPHKLLQDTEGYFFKLVQKTGPLMSQQLHKIAEAAYKKTQGDEIPLEENNTIPV